MPNYAVPLGTAVPTPTGQIVYPNSPDGGSLTARAYTSGFNYVNTKTSTSEMLDITLNVQSAQQGTAAISNTASITVSGIAAGALQVFRWS